MTSRNSHAGCDFRLQLRWLQYAFTRTISSAPYLDDFVANSADDFPTDDFRHMPALAQLPTAIPCRKARPLRGDFRYALDEQLPLRPRWTTSDTPISDAPSTDDFQYALYGQILRCTLDGWLPMPKLGLLAPGW